MWSLAIQGNFHCLLYCVITIHEQTYGQTDGHNAHSKITLNLETQLLLASPIAYLLRLLH